MTKILCFKLQTSIKSQSGTTHILCAIACHRAMDFTVAILLKLQEDDEIELCKAVKETYALTLMQFHGFIASTAFSVRAYDSVTLCVCIQPPLKGFF